jgi:hypothetical protein
MSENGLMKPRSGFDKQLAKIAQQRIWESVPECVAFLVGLVNDGEATDKDRIAAAKLLLDRTIPTVQRIDATGLMGVIGIGTSSGIDWVELHRRAVDEVEEVERGNGNATDPRIH